MAKNRFYFSKEHTILSYRSSMVHNSLLPLTKTKFAGFFKSCTRKIFFFQKFVRQVVTSAVLYLNSKHFIITTFKTHQILCLGKTKEFGVPHKHYLFVKCTENWVFQQGNKFVRHIFHKNLSIFWHVWSSKWCNFRGNLAIFVFHESYDLWGTAQHKGFDSNFEIIDSVNFFRQWNHIVCLILHLVLTHFDYITVLYYTGIVMCSDLQWVLNCTYWPIIGWDMSKNVKAQFFSDKTNFNLENIAFTFLFISWPIIGG